MTTNAGINHAIDDADLLYKDFNTVGKSLQEVEAALDMAKDRGKNIRTEARWNEMARSVFPSCTARIVKGLLRLPYTHIVIECRNAVARDRRSSADEEIVPNGAVAALADSAAGATFIRRSHS